MPQADAGQGGWSAEQLRNASIIYRVGRSMGLGARDIQIALITAMVESNLINVHYGDRDSLGLFQQRPSQGWGTPEQVMDPKYAAHKFFTSLLALGDKRFQMNMGAAAQAVQRSAFPDRYAERIGAMRAMWPKIAQGGGDTPMTMDGTPYLGGATVDAPQAMPSELADMMLSSPSEASSIPSIQEMLGTSAIGPAPTDPFMDGSGSVLSEGTNQLMQQVSGPYAKGVDGWRKAVIDAAKSALHTPYAWGGDNLQSGVDCSGLIAAAFAKAGINMPRISFQQANVGKRVKLRSLQPGDLVAWDNSPRNNGADHIAIYLGNGYIIESPKPGLSVRIRKLGSGEGAWGVHLNF